MRGRCDGHAGRHDIGDRTAPPGCRACPPAVRLVRRGGDRRPLRARAGSVRPVGGNPISTSADPLAAWTGTLLLFSGSTQLALLQLLAGGAPLWTAIAAAILINARLLEVSGGLALLWAGTPLRAKVLGGATIVDATWAVAEQRRRTGPSQGALRVGELLDRPAVEDHESLMESPEVLIARQAVADIREAE